MALAIALTALLLLLLKREGALEVVKKLALSLLLLVLLVLLKFSVNEALLVAFERKGRLKGELLLLR